MSSPAGPRVSTFSSSQLYIHLSPTSSPRLSVDTEAQPAGSTQLEIEITPDEPLPATPIDTRWLPRTPKSIHRKRSVVSALQLDRELDKKQFGLSDIQVYNVSPTDPFEFDTQSPLPMEYRPPASMSGSTPSSSGANGSSGLSAPQAITSSSSRMRNPPPPSPLSKVSSPSDPAHTPGPPSPGVALSPPALSHETVTSPCYIHSYLDKHGNGSLHDYVNAKSSQSPAAHSPQASRRLGTPLGSGTPQTARPHHVHNSKPHIQLPHHNQHGSPSHKGGSRTSPVASAASTSGYDSDRSEATGLGLTDGDYDEEGGNLTKQLAETAQGVREMSKELQRTRVRSRIQSVLIVTKARDNALIRLTRELAIYLMQKRASSGGSSADQPKSSMSSSSIASQSPGSSDRGMIVYVDAQLRHSKRFDAEGIKRDHPEFSKALHRRRSSSSVSVNTMSAYPSSASLGEAQRKKREDEGQLRYWTSEMCSGSPHLFDFVITLGGDGTVLFTSWLFQKIVPPILPFALGSLGFLTNFDFSSYAKTMDRVLEDGIRVNLRMRFTCTVYRAVAPEEASKAAQATGGGRRKAIKRPGGEILMSTVDKAGWEALEGSSNPSSCQKTEGAKDKEIMCFSTRPVEQFEVLNDLVVDRGPSPYVSLLEIFGDEHHLTTVQADGLTVSTPTGSTAYSLSAGGSLVHPQIPAILLTPICPHTLSFRPMLLPDSMELRICVPYNSRSTAWASFDGRGRVELKQGDHIKVTASKYPFPTVCADKASTDWFSSISRTLRWNEREKQKSFVVVEEDDAGPSDGPKGGPKQQLKNKRHAEAGNEDDPKEAQRALRKHDEEDEEEEEEDDDEDDTFDIDDASGGEATGSPPSPAQFSDDHEQSSSQPNQPSKTHHAASPPKSGVSTPSRFATQCSGPPPLSQRHLVQKLAAAGVELKEKDNERGQRDEIRSDSSAFRIAEAGHAIPTDRDDGADAGMSTPKLKERQRTREKEDGHAHGHGHGRAKGRDASQGREGKAKAFAFFGQDDSGSEMSDDLQEP